MKRIIIFIAALFTVLSCTEKDITTPKPGYKTITLKAVAGQSGPSKTTLSGSQVLWKAEDAILAIDNEGNVATLTAHADKITEGGKYATFTGEAAESFGKIAHAFYPAENFINLNFNQNEITLKLPQSTTIEDSFKNNPSYAYVGGESTDIVTFHNICGILAFTLEVDIDGAYEGMNRLMISSKSSQISGYFTVNFTDSDNITLSQTSTTDSNKTIEIDPQSSKWQHSGFSLDFYYVVPEGAFNDGIKIETKPPHGDPLETTHKIKIAKSQISKMPGISYGVGESWGAVQLRWMEN